MNIDDLYRDIEEYGEHGENRLAYAFGQLADAYENDEDMDKAVFEFKLIFPDHQIPNFIEWDYERVMGMLKEKK